MSYVYFKQTNKMDVNRKHCVVFTTTLPRYPSTATPKEVNTMDYIIMSVVKNVYSIQYMRHKDSMEALIQCGDESRDVRRLLRKIRERGGKVRLDYNLGHSTRGHILISEYNRN